MLLRAGIIATNLTRHIPGGMVFMHYLPLKYLMYGSENKSIPEV